MSKTCADCLHLNLNDTKWGEYYCSSCNKYRKANDYCSSFLDRKEASKVSGSDYQRSGLQCYITTIVCELLGYPDDCEVLQILRGFRENVLKMDPNYLPILYEYDQVGPVIAEALRAEEQNKRLAIELLQAFLIPCTLAIKSGSYDEAITIYTNMVNMLKARFGLVDAIVDYSIEIPFEDLGKARCRISKPTTIEN